MNETMQVTVTGHEKLVSLRGSAILFSPNPDDIVVVEGAAECASATCPTRALGRTCAGHLSGINRYGPVTLQHLSVGDQLTVLPHPAFGGGQP